MVGVVGLGGGRLESQICTTLRLPVNSYSKGNVVGIFKKGDRAEIKSGVLKGTKGKIVNTNEKDKYGRSHVMQSDDGEIISPVTDKELKKL